MPGVERIQLPRTEARIHPLTRLDGRFFAVVSPDGRLVNVILAHDLCDAQAALVETYGRQGHVELTLHPAQLSWVQHG